MLLKGVHTRTEIADLGNDENVVSVFPTTVDADIRLSDFDFIELHAIIMVGNSDHDDGMAGITPERLKELRAAYLVGDRTDDLDKIDAKYGGGDLTVWNVALDGHRFGRETRDEFFGEYAKAIAEGCDENESEERAYTLLDEKDS